MTCLFDSSSFLVASLNGSLSEPVADWGIRVANRGGFAGGKAGDEEAEGAEAEGAEAEGAVAEAEGAVTEAEEEAEGAVTEAEEEAEGAEAAGAFAGVKGRI